MNRVIKSLLSALVLVAVSTSTGLSQSAITILDIGGGVRALAMGEAFIGLSNDEQAIYYNPAGVAFLDGIHANANFARHLGAGSYLSLLGGTRNIGASLNLISLGGVEERDNSDNVVGTISYSNFALSAGGGTALSALPLGFTRNLTNLAMGAKFNFVSVSSVEGGSGSGFSFGLSGLYRATELVQNAGLRSLSLVQFGYTLENLISIGVGYGEGHSERLPFKFKTGFAVKPLNELTVLLDFAVPFEFHIGGEYSLAVPDPLTGVDLRAGGAFKSGTFSFTAGFGIARDPFRFDYAYSSHPRLPGSHRLAASLKF